MIHWIGGFVWWWDDIPGLWVRKWVYFNQTSWRHGSAQVWKIRMAW